MICFGAVTVFIIAADLITKALVVSGMEINSTITVIPGVFDLTYIINRGAAWGILADKKALLSVFTVVVLAALVYYVVKKHKSISRLELVSIAMIVGGGIGNLIGRVFDGYVVDFINLRFVSFFNIFNIADIGITVGCVLLLISVLFFSKKEPAREAADLALDEEHAAPEKAENDG
ncbi:MAG: signal peptidase II [Firmicutes bacterium]|nr:signal peptidase II [Bacillota bacterium]